MCSKTKESCWPLVTMAVMGALLTACGNPQSVAPPQASQPVAKPETRPDPVAQAEPARAPLAVVKVAAPEAGGEPELASMQVAQVVSSKLGVAVDLRYQFDGDAMSGQPVTLHLAAVPRVAGTNLAVSVKQEAGIEFPKATLNAAKVEMAATYRQDLQVRRMAGGPQELRVLVTMDFPIGTGFSYFSVPLDGTSKEKKP